MNIVLLQKCVLSSPSVTRNVFIPLKPGRFCMIFWKLLPWGAVSVSGYSSETLPGLWNAFSSPLQALHSPVQTKRCWGHSGHNFGLQGQNQRLVCIFLPFGSHRFLSEQPLTGNIVQILLLAFNVVSCSNFREPPASQVGLGVGCTWQRSC